MVFGLCFVLPDAGSTVSMLALPAPSCSGSVRLTQIDAGTLEQQWLTSVCIQYSTLPDTAHAWYMYCLAQNMCNTHRFDDKL